MTLRELIAHLERLNPDMTCKPAWGEADSWRGVYSEIAFGPTERATVRQMLGCARAAVGATFEGYKGGSFKMDLDTQVHVAAYGDYNGDEDNITFERFPWLDVARSEMTSALDALRAELAEMTASQRSCWEQWTLAAQNEKSLEAERDKLREALWLSHGHVTALYGDDGEMQCPVCMVDFKRQPVDEIIAGMRRAALAASKEGKRKTFQCQKCFKHVTSDNHVCYNGDPNKREANKEPRDA